MSNSILDKRMDRHRKAQHAKEAADIKIVVKNLHQLKEAIIPFLPKSQEEKSIITTSTKDLKHDATEKIIPNSTISAEIHIPNMNRILCQGMELAERQAQMSDMELDEDIFGGFKPAKLPKGDSNYLWVDTLIKHRLDGKRRGDSVIWELAEGTFLFNPRTGQLVQEK